MIGAAGPGMLAGLRVVEVADELGEYCGLLFAGLGADVIKVEPPEGSPTRKIGPFLDDSPHPERSIFFWHYNRNKRSVTLDAKTDEGRDAPAAPDRRRRPPDRFELRRAQRLARSRSRRAHPPLSRPGRRANDAVRRRRPVGELQGLRPRPSRARRPDDELRLRPRSRPALRPAADRAAAVARLSHRRRAAGHRRSSPRCCTGCAPARARTSPARCTRPYRRTPSST